MNGRCIVEHGTCLYRPCSDVLCQWIASVSLVMLRAELPGDESHFYYVLFSIRCHYNTHVSFAFKTSQVVEAERPS